MVCSPERLLELLDKGGFRHWDASDPEDGSLIVFRGSHSSQPFVLVHVSLDSGGEILTAMAMTTLRVKEHPFLSALMQAMLHEAYLTSLGQWEMNSNEGEVRLTVQLPLFGTEPTELQVARIVTSAAYLVDRAWPRLCAILETGEDPALSTGSKTSVQRELKSLQMRMQKLLQEPGADNENN